MKDRTKIAMIRITLALALLTSAVSGLQINRKVSKREEVAAKEFSDSAYATHATTQTGFNSTLRSVEEKNIVTTCADVYIPVPIGQSGVDFFVAIGGKYSIELPSSTDLSSIGVDAVAVTSMDVEFAGRMSLGFKIGKLLATGVDVDASVSFHVSMSAAVIGAGSAAFLALKTLAFDWYKKLMDSDEAIQQAAAKMQTYKDKALASYEMGLSRPNVVAPAWVTEAQNGGDRSHKEVQTKILARAFKEVNIKFYKRLHEMWFMPKTGMAAKMVPVASKTEEEKEAAFKKHANFFIEKAFREVVMHHGNWAPRSYPSCSKIVPSHRGQLFFVPSNNRSPDDWTVYSRVLMCEITKYGYPLEVNDRHHEGCAMHIHCNGAGVNVLPSILKIMPALLPLTDYSAGEEHTKFKNNFWELGQQAIDFWDDFSEVSKDLTGGLTHEGETSVANSQQSALQTHTFANVKFKASFAFFFSAFSPPVYCNTAKFKFSVSQSIEFTKGLGGSFEAGEHELAYQVQTPIVTWDWAPKPKKWKLSFEIPLPSQSTVDFIDRLLTYGTVAATGVETVGSLANQAALLAGSRSIISLRTLLCGGKNKRAANTAGGAATLLGNIYGGVMTALGVVAAQAGTLGTTEAFDWPADIMTSVLAATVGDVSYSLLISVEKEGNTRCQVEIGTEVAHTKELFTGTVRAAKSHFVRLSAAEEDNACCKVRGDPILRCSTNPQCQGFSVNGQKATSKPANSRDWDACMADTAENGCKAKTSCGKPAAIKGQLCANPAAVPDV